MLTINFWKGALERAVKSFFQTFVAVVTAALGAEAIGVSAGLLDVSWLDALSIAGLTTVLSLATSLGNADFTAGRGAIPNVGEVTLVHDVRMDETGKVQVNTSAEDDEPTAQPTYNIQVPEGMDFKTAAEKLRAEKYFPRSIKDKPDMRRFVSFTTDPDLTGEVDIYVNGEKIGVAPIFNQRVLYKLPELPAGDNKVSAVHPERGVLYTFTFDSEPGKHVAE
ncbi:holin [Glutamicibacter protophormiae]|uniref:Holin n=1 Tax=Glutamicibacter protophormiae TaxID=37930 RepID=A0ABS4XRL7_GLUPR|nr:holin [Glutamicibacter protophormiae]MBP2398922.1 hypothetical protein [Glutamicibacter protophormiae]GGL83622.1 hypothetical protein GCM10010038_11900 [Glutamicibacter protophormiae]